MLLQWMSLQDLIRIPGIAHEKCVHANATVTFHRLKIGLLNNKHYTGTVHLERIGIPREAERGVIEE